MTHIATCILELLKANSGVSAIAGDRIYPDSLPYTDPVLPALRITLVDDVPDDDVPDLSTARVQVSCYSNPQEVNGIKDPKEVEQLAAAVKAALHAPDLKKTPLSQTVNGVVHYISRMKLSSERRFREDQTDYYHKPMDFMVTYRTD